MEDLRKVFLFDREGISGEDETLGFEILVTMLKSMANRRELPAALVFWNTAVKLLTKSSPILRHLVTLEEKGVPLLAGKLCLQELNITELGAGRSAGMDEILDLFDKHAVVSL